MSDPVPTPPAVPPSPLPVKERADQDQAKLDRIVACGQKLAIALGDAEIVALLAPRGFDAAKLQAGVTLQQTALARFTARQSALKLPPQASAARESAEATAREMYSEFRENARRLYKSSADRANLALNGTVSKDTQKFIGMATISYTNAQKEPYAAVFADNGYPAAYLASALAAVEAFKLADQDQNAAIGAATKTTADRDAAFKELDRWMKIFERLTETALKHRPDLLKKLNG